MFEAYTGYPVIRRLLKSIAGAAAAGFVWVHAMSAGATLVQASEHLPVAQAPHSIRTAVTLPASPAAALIDNFHVVTPGELYRGALPGEEGMAELARLGIRTSLSLVTDDDDVEAEERAATAHGLRFVSIEFSGFFSPSDRKVEAALAVLADPANHPVYVHCRYGRDRTGLIVGLHRVLHQGWKKRDAYQEMLQRGFRPQLFLLKAYFDERTRALPVF